MACTSQAVLLNVSNKGCKLFRNFHFNSVMCLDQNWRQENKLTCNPNSFGPLTNLPDYSFADHRVVPYGSGQLKRINKQKDILVKMKKMIGEIDYAVERHKQLQAEQERKSKLVSVLKPKNIAYFEGVKSETKI